MASLSANQLTALGDHFLLFAQSVGNYRYVNSGKLTTAQNLNIKEAHLKLLDYADSFYTASATVIVNDVEGSLDTINTITKQINDTYQFLTKIQKALDVAAAGIALAEALFSQNPQAVADAVDGLVNVWKGATSKKAT